MDRCRSRACYRPFVDMKERVLSVVWIRLGERRMPVIDSQVLYWLQRGWQLETGTPEC